MAEHDSLYARFKADVFSSSSMVILVAAVFALVGAYATQAWTAGAVSGVGALLGVGIGVPSLYDEWNTDIAARKAFIWAVLASAVALGVYALAFVGLTRLGVGAGLGDALAGGATVALAIAYALYRTHVA
ncbi:hypothetical protein [Halococcus sediminicola]|uniref:hypothetical protein n=1 Tax=Halococcus sediminicola TaxID=1264579 RepID=UPI000678F50F|nr:hypothetical protein [Halococcus sediminicola]